MFVRIFREGKKMLHPTYTKLGRQFTLVGLLITFTSGGLMQTTAGHEKMGQDKSKPGRPNVIIVLTDDQGWGDLSLNGNQNLSTPNIDQLAADGARFDRFFVCPVCSPTRAEFLTGRYHPRSGVYSTSAGGERMNLDEVTIADTFKAAGYATGAFGKWHNGMQYPYHPNGRGFQEFYGFCSGHWGNYFDPMLEHNGEIVEGRGFCVDDFTDRLLRFVETHKDKPFFAYLPLNTPHSPMQVPDRFWDKFKNKDLAQRHRDPKKENLPHTRAALAMCENIDWNVGRIVKKLEELELTENTIVVYFCDNGPNGSRWNGGMKGRKGSTDEGGVRSPLLVKYPGRIARGKKVREISSVTDLLPTLAALCDVPLISQKKLDGMSLVPVLTQSRTSQLGQLKEIQDRVIVNSWKSKVSVRSQRFRFDNKGQLYDLEKDPEQRKNVANDYPGLIARFTKIANDYRRNVLAGYNDDKRPFVIGHNDYKFTQVPARDGKAQGNIKRSNRFPNCSYFYNWTDVGDKITWDAEIGASGNYEVVLYYACPKSDVGSEFSLTFNKSQIRGKINEAHDPPLRGAAEDRVQRVESYVKDFKPLKLGTMHLEKGKGQLKLQATDIPGKQAMEFRLLMFIRK